VIRYLVPAFLALCIAVPFAGAQSVATGSILSSGASAPNPGEGRFIGDKARAYTDNYAMCVVKRHLLQVKKALALTVYTAEQHTALGKLFDKECFTGNNNVGVAEGGMDIEMNISPGAFRGALFKALVRSEYSKRPLALVQNPVIVAGVDPKILVHADCVVRRTPEGVRKLIATIAGSSKENASFEEIKPDMGQCQAADYSPRYPTGQLINIFAEAYFREAEASKLVSAK
jgi:hypothetical protein